MSAIVERALGEERIAGHDRLRHHRARIVHVRDVPAVGVLAADAGEVGPGALRAPLERVVVHALGGEAVMAVALHLVAQRADHLAVAIVAALADVDVAAGELERRVGTHALHLLDRGVEQEQRRDLDEAADGDTTTRMPISSTIEFFSKKSVVHDRPLTPPAPRPRRRAAPPPPPMPAARPYRPRRRRGSCATR